VKTSELKEWLGVITNVGVIAGLAFVAFEIHQNNIALEQNARNAEVEMLDGIRSAWQNWEYAIIENEDVADIWRRGSSGESLDPTEAVRFETLGREYFRLVSQNYRQYTTLRGEPADWAIDQLIRAMEEYPGLRGPVLRQLDRSNDTPFKRRIRELDPPELRAEEGSY
jgi:hypothetical protein